MISWYLQLQLIRNRCQPRKHVSNSVDENPNRTEQNPNPTIAELEPNTNPEFSVLAHL